MPEHRKRSTIGVVVAGFLLAAAGCGVEGLATPVEESVGEADLEDPSGTEGRSDRQEEAPEIDDADLSADADGPVAGVRRVKDGDSLEVDLGGREVEIRLQNYNAPEKFGFDNRETCNGQASTDALVGLVEGAEVVVVGGDTDRFGRTLADLVVDDRSVTASLIAAGHGLSTRDRADWRNLMKQAAADGRGMWGDRCGEPLSDGLIIGDTNENPDGPDEDRLDEEWVEIVNVGAGPIDLEGWVIRDDTTSHRFPLSGTLGPGADLRIRTGGGDSTGSDLYLGERFPVWSNSDETVLLVDPSGVVADWVFLDG